MSKPFIDLLGQMPSERRKHIRLKTEVLKNEMALRELREALDLTQEQLARSLNMKQAAISKFEHQSDIYLSTLRRILHAMGAELKIIARFKDGEVLINQFNDIRRDVVLKRQVEASEAKVEQQH